MGGRIEKKKKKKQRKRREADCLFSGVKKGRERKKEDDSKEDTKAISREDRSRPIIDPKDTSNLRRDKIKSSRRRRGRSDATVSFLSRKTAPYTSFYCKTTSPADVEELDILQ